MPDQGCLSGILSLPGLLEALIHASSDGVWIIDTHGSILLVNKVQCQRLGFSQAEMVGRPVWEFDADHDKAQTQEQIDRIRTRGSGLFRTHQISKTGAHLEIEIMASYLDEGDGHMVCYCRDLTEVQSSRACFSSLFSTAPVLMAVTEIADDRLVDVNQCFLETLGLKMEDVIGKTMLDLGYLSRDQRDLLVQELQACGRADGLDLELTTSSGRTIDCLYFGEMIPYGGQLRMLSIGLNITERRRSEKGKSLITEVFRALGETTNTEDLVKHVTRMLHRWMEVDAVGLRLEQDGDFPYFETRGFDEEFVINGSSLCTWGPDNKPIIDADGQLVLGCFCGAVVRRKVDPSLSFFTPYGSFWTNDLGSLRDSPLLDMEKGRYRFQCHFSGYRSVALIPLIHGDEILGLVQFNDCRPGLFDEPLIHELEHMARSLAVGLSHRKVEAARKESEERLRMALKGTQDALWDWDPHSDQAYYSDRFFTMLGYSPDDLPHTGAAWRDSLHPEDRGPAEQRVEEYLRGDADQYDSTFRMRTKSGEYRWIRGRGMAGRDEMGRPGRFIGFHTDITPIKEAEFKLRESEERFRRLYEDALLSYQSLDQDGRLLQLNKTWCQMLGYAKNEVLGRDFADFLPPETRNRFRRNFKRFKLSGRISGSEFPMIRKDGEQIMVALNGKVECHADGSFHLTHCVLTDISERYKAREEAAKLETQLQQVQKMQTVGRLAGGVAHDFNNKLATIMGNVELALPLVKHDLVLKELLQEVESAANHSAELTQQLLGFARKQTVDPRVLDVNEVIGQLINLIRRLIGENIQLNWVPCVQELKVKMDPGQMDQILTNLVVNARDAIVDIGHITVETSVWNLDDPEEARLREMHCGPHLELRVTDDGIGMDEETQAQIFDPFFTTKGQGEGTGLGLSTVFGIIRQNRGDVVVRSAPDSGTTFRILLPLTQEVSSLKTDVSTGKDLGKSVATATLLLVEDEEPLLKLADKVLTTAGYDVLASSCPIQALEMVRDYEGEIDLLVTDVLMPRMNGRQLADEVKALRPEIGRIFMSGYPADALRREGHDTADEFFLQKPYLNSQLKKLVRRALGE